jgi:hypothetical protein
MAIQFQTPISFVSFDPYDPQLSIITPAGKFDIQKTVENILETLRPISHELEDLQKKFPNAFKADYLGRSITEDFSSQFNRKKPEKISLIRNENGNLSPSPEEITEWVNNTLDSKKTIKPKQVIHYEAAVGNDTQHHEIFRIGGPTTLCIKTSSGNLNILDEVRKALQNIRHPKPDDNRGVNLDNSFVKSFKAKMPKKIHLLLGKDNLFHPLQSEIENWVTLAEKNKR